MDFSKTNLRSNKSPLLSRIQRQTDVRNEKLLSAPKPLSLSDSIELDGEHEIEQSLLEPVKEKTRLGLLRRRGGRD